MKIDKVLEAINEVLSRKDLDLWYKDEEIKRLKTENESLSTEHKRLMAEIIELTERLRMENNR